MDFVTIPLYLPLLLLLVGALLLGLVGLAGWQTRLSLTAWAWLATLFPLGAFVLVVGFTTAVLTPATSTPLTWQTNWIPTVNWPFTLYFDGLTALFTLLVSGIGTLIIIYTGYYFKGDNSAWRFICYMLLFMMAMMGLVMAGDVITLFVFWELTSVTSYLLVAYKYKYAEARDGAFKALFITGGGGIALLGGLLMVSTAVGGTTWEIIFSQRELLVNSWLYPVMLFLVSFGAFTKSAQFPAHIWLPRAMTAPTPASAFLHSATMVKAGIYLLARMHPALGQTEAWFWLLTIVGGTTMVTGAYLGLKQNDLKALLAYSTISQLGALVMLIGQDTAVAFKALVIGILAHALFKSALFMVVGNVDHEMGTRDLRYLGGVRRVMPYTFVVAVLGGLSMAGLPPLLGFLAKETLLATAVHESLPSWVAILLSTAVVITGALKIVHAGLLVIDGFTGEPRDPSRHGHETPFFMWLIPGIPALLSLLIGILPEPLPLAMLLAQAAEAAYGDTVKVSLALWTGLNIPLALSAVAIVLGVVLFYYRVPVRAWLFDAGGASFDKVYDDLLWGLDKAAWLATRLQHGRVRVYLTIILFALLSLITIFGGWFLPDLNAATWVANGDRLGLDLLRLFAMLLAASTAVMAIFLTRDFYAILALGLSGLAVALVMILEPAPDIALVQIVVDILAVIILVLALTRLPRPQRQSAQRLNQFKLDQLGPALVALGVGALTTLISYYALTSRPRPSAVTPYYEANAKNLVGATDIVGAIVIDFRALDTLIEIAVFGLAGIGVYNLLLYATKKWPTAVSPRHKPSHPLLTKGIGGATPSPFLRMAGYILLPFTLILAITHMMYGHDQPGDGFTAGVIISLGVGFWYVLFGYEATVQKLRWLRPSWLIGAGLLLAISTALFAALWQGAFFSHVNMGGLIGLPLPTGFSFSTSFLFEVAIALTVVGGIAHMLNSLGQPDESNQKER
jgi:NADH:ubiquinone oxidoreductase subunit 5 (subunit L)/multisubunit Na+/H+ antiporter MnhA subunit/multisubunit Na+/H+ antiporter MnhB subunit